MKTDGPSFAGIGGEPQCAFGMFIVFGSKSGRAESNVQRSIAMPSWTYANPHRSTRFAGSDWQFFNASNARYGCRRATSARNKSGETSRKQEHRRTTAPKVGVIDA